MSPSTLYDPTLAWLATPLADWAAVEPLGTLPALRVLNLNFNKLAAVPSAADGTVAIAAIGFATNLDALLRSPPDATSHLNGTELVARKVRVTWRRGWCPSTSQSISSQPA